MGDWNKTCGISRTPIKSGDKVRLLFIASTRKDFRSSPEFSSISKGNLNCSYEDFKIIGGLPLQATYDKYGLYKIKNSKGIEASYVLDQIKKYYVQTDKDVYSEIEQNNKKHTNVRKESLTFSKIQKMIMQGELYIKHFDPKYYSFVSIMEIHEEVYQTLMNIDNITYDYELSKTVKMDFDTYIAVKMKKFYEWKEKIDNKVAERLEKKQFPNLPEDALISFLKKSTMFMIEREESYNTFYSLSGQHIIIDLLELLDQRNEEKEEVVVKKLIEAELFAKKLDEFNIMIRPSLSTNETDDLDNQLRFLKPLLNTLKKMQKEQDS